MHRRAVLALLTIIPPAARAAAAAKPLAHPIGRVILTVRGRIGRRNSPDGANFDLAMLDAMPQGRFQGDSPWTRGEAAYDGPLGGAVLDSVAPEGSEMVVTALNDYVAVIPIADFRRWPVVLATRIDGRPLTVRERGPIWIFYPMDNFPDLRNEIIYNRSVWQVRTIEIR